MSRSVRNTTVIGRNEGGWRPEKDGKLLKLTGSGRNVTVDKKRPKYFSDRQERRRVAPRERRQATEAEWLRKERDSR
jgi:hypothetical protein